MGPLVQADFITLMSIIIKIVHIVLGKNKKYIFIETIVVFTDVKLQPIE